jgi:S-adenosylmethionine uptake transporter
MQSLWMLVASLLFAAMGACVKLASARYGILEIVFYRSVLGCVGLAAFVRLRGGTLTTSVPWLHLRRGAFGTAALSLWFFSTTALPLGTSMTLNYASSLYLAAFVVAAAVLAGRRVNWPLAATVVTGFVGVLLVLTPSLNREQAAAGIAGFVSGILSASAYWHVKELGKLGEPEWRTVFYFSLAGVVLGLAGSLLTGFTAHTADGVLLLATIGVTATLAQLAMTRAYSAGRTLLTANLQYSAIVFATLLGMLLFADRIPLAGWLGIAMIIGSGIVATLITRRDAPLPAPNAESVAEEHFADADASPANDGSSR